MKAEDIEFLRKSISETYKFTASNPMTGEPMEFPRDGYYMLNDLLDAEEKRNQTRDYGLILCIDGQISESFGIKHCPFCGSSLSECGGTSNDQK